MGSIEERRKHLAALRAFVNSPAHFEYQSALAFEIESTKNSIVTIPPNSLENIAELLMLHGELRILESGLDKFEKACVSLEDRIDEMVEKELENATETKK